MKSVVRVYLKGRKLLFEGIPEGYEIEYLARDPEGVLYLVIRPKDWAERGSYNTFRLFIGQGEKMREVDVLKVIRHRDGGTTYIKFRSRKRGGELYFPSLFMREARPKVTYHDVMEAVELELLIRAKFLLPKNQERRP